MKPTQRQLRTRFENIFLDAAIEALLKERKRMAKVSAEDLSLIEGRENDFKHDFQWEGNGELAVEAGHEAVRKARLLTGGDLPSYVDSVRLERLVCVQVNNIMIQPCKQAVRFYKERLKDARSIVEHVYRSRLEKSNIGHFNAPSFPNYGSEERPQANKVDGLDIV